MINIGLTLDGVSGNILCDGLTFNILYRGLHRCSYFHSTAGVSDGAISVANVSGNVSDICFSTLDL